MNDMTNPLFDLTKKDLHRDPGAQALHAFFPLTDIPAVTAAVSVAALFSMSGGPVTLGLALLFVLIFSGLLEKLLEKHVEHFDKVVEKENKERPKTK